MDKNIPGRDPEVRNVVGMFKEQQNGGWLVELMERKRGREWKLGQLKWGLGGHIEFLL